MKAYKLFRKMKDGTLRPLFINKSQVIPIGETLFAETHPTKGFKVRSGWHCCEIPRAPHLKLRPKNQPRRVWCEVEIWGYNHHKRPKSQGGMWFTARYMKVIRELDMIDVFRARLKLDESKK